MSIPEELTLKKSDTHSFALPNINKSKSHFPKYKTSRMTQHKSVFIEKVKDLTKNVAYEEMETTGINEEQKKLKNLLRQFHHETYNIMTRYIDRPANQSAKKKRSTSVSIVEVRDKQIGNSNSALEICKKELEQLQRKCDNLKFVTVEEFQRQIEKIKDQIEETVLINKEIIKGNTLRGLSIKRDDNKISREIQDLQQQKYVLEMKKQRLSEDAKYVEDEQQSLKEKNTKAQEELKKISEDYEKAIKSQQSLEEQKKIKVELEDKKKNYKGKKQQDYQSKYQYHYLKLLKDMDQEVKKCKQIDQNTLKTSQKLENSKKQLIVYEHKLRSIKKQTNKSSGSVINDKNSPKPMKS